MLMKLQCGRLLCVAKRHKSVQRLPIRNCTNTGSIRSLSVPGAPGLSSLPRGKTTRRAPSSPPISAQSWETLNRTSNQPAFKFKSASRIVRAADRGWSRQLAQRGRPMATHSPRVCLRA